jgi:hypothetical protein
MLCNQTQETAAHLLFHCRYSKRLWGMVKSWIGIPSIHLHAWTDDLNLEGWWSKLLNEASDNRKALSSIIMLVSWTIWKERNARIFNHKSVPNAVLLNIIKTEVKLWVAAGAKCLSFVTTGE